MNKQAYLQRDEFNNVVGVIKGVDDTFGQRKIGFRKIQCHSLDDFYNLCKHLEIDSVPKTSVLELVSKPLTRCSAAQPVDYSKLDPRITDSLFPHQRDSINKIVETFNGSCLFISPAGSGKTRVVSIAANHYKGKILFITTGQILKKVKTELEECGVKDAVIVRGRKLPKNCDKLPKVVITTHQTVALNEYIKNRKEWNLVIVDESSTMKNKDAQLTQAILEVLENANRKILMSATPMEKCPSELYTQLLPFLGKRVLGTYDEFIIRYCSAKWEDEPFYRRGGYSMPWNKKARKQVLTRHDARFMEEVNIMLDYAAINVKVDMSDLLPPKKRYVEYVELTTEQLIEQSLVQAELDHCKDKGEKRLLINQWYRMNELHKVEHGLKWLLKWLDENPDKKIIVNYNSLDVAEYIKARLPADIKCAVVNSKTTQSKREAIIADLAEKKKPGTSFVRVGLMSIGTCSFGVTYPPGTTTLAFFGLPWNPSFILQCEGKVHRLGAEDGVNIYWILANDSYDDKLLKLIQKKTNVVSRVVDNCRKTIEFDEKAIGLDECESEDNEYDITSYFEPQTQQPEEE